MFIVNPYIYGAAQTLFLADDYSPDFIYSCGLQIDAADSDIMRVRRSSDSAESDFNATEVNDGTLTTWTGANDGFIVKLYNLGSGGATYDLVQSTAASQPQIVTAGVLETKNSRGSAKFDGSNDFLSTGTSTLNTTSISTFTAISIDSTGAAGWYMSTRSTNTDPFRWACDSRTTPTRHFMADLSTNYFADLSTAYNNTDMRLLLTL